VGKIGLIKNDDRGGASRCLVNLGMGKKEKKKRLRAHRHEEKKGGLLDTKRSIRGNGLKSSGFERRAIDGTLNGRDWSMGKTVFL